MKRFTLRTMYSSEPEPDVEIEDDEYVIGVQPVNSRRDWWIFVAKTEDVGSSD